MLASVDERQIAQCLRSSLLFSLGLQHLTDSEKDSIISHFEDLKKQEILTTYTFAVRDILSEYYRYLLPEVSIQEQQYLKSLTPEDRENKVLKDARKIMNSLGLGS
jgi:hypothetical protein